ncbi:uncharacterized protein LOC110389316 isoform X2 [Numida meleagris]|uniref:uncharacterized protein LOC110389316 isoform X2 n=1 Tax=Numida meleagris TaxID=8996 RepID=UPI000B3E1861|nr:uncharacterized protein LOC110389316 isoform X2 [Numida meleagris]
MCMQVSHHPTFAVSTPQCFAVSQASNDLPALPLLSFFQDFTQRGEEQIRLQEIFFPVVRKEQCFRSLVASNTRFSEQFAISLSRCWAKRAQPDFGCPSGLLYRRRRASQQAWQQQAQQRYKAAADTSSGPAHSSAPRKAPAQARKYIARDPLSSWRHSNNLPQASNHPPAPWLQESSGGGPTAFSACAFSVGSRAPPPCPPAPCPRGGGRGRSRHAPRPPPRQSPPALRRGAHAARAERLLRRGTPRRPAAPKGRQQRAIPAANSVQQSAEPATLTREAAGYITERRRGSCLPAASRTAPPQLMPRRLKITRGTNVSDWRTPAMLSYNRGALAQA